MVILSSGLGIGAIGLWITFRFYHAHRGTILHILLRLAAACAEIGIIATRSDVAGKLATGQLVPLPFFRVETIFVSRHSSRPSVAWGEILAAICMKRFV
ncbi:hypothetical protein [Sphingobium sp. B2]|uniref:hypothetical protein n=1 Tax=Sphingobium sp. B2 TaxID=2583228 RepID=UPI001643D1A3|nr:hypothetical protein [Sphingobium sp. B2]